MKKEDLDLIAKELLGLIEGKTTTMASDKEAPYYVDINTYTDLELFEREKKMLFKERPLLMAFSNDLPENGDFITNEDTGIPILITRNSEGRVKAFLNVCRHRGARLEDVPCGKKPRGFVCPYHAWKYDHDGKLTSIYGEDTFGEIDKSSHGLTELAAEEKYGMIYVRPTPGPSMSVDDILGDKLGPQLGTWDLGSMHLVDRKIFTMPTNWKLALDTFCEGYHFGPLHSETIGDTTYSNVMTYDKYGYNHRVGFANKTILELNDLPESEWEPLHHFQFVYFLFPNVIILVSPDYVNYFELYPGKKVNNHLTRFSLYKRFPMKTEEEKREAQDQYDFIYSVVEKDDYWVSENVMKGFKSGLHPHSIFGKNELSLIYMHQAFRDAVGLDPKDVELKRVK